jgi:hypothetical protein
MGDDEERTEGIFYSVIAYEMLRQKPNKPPLPELCTLPISRPIVYPDTKLAGEHESHNQPPTPVTTPTMAAAPRRLELSLAGATTPNI